MKFASLRLRVSDLCDSSRGNLSFLIDVGVFLERRKEETRGLSLTLSVVVNAKCHITCDSSIKCLGTSGSDKAAIGSSPTPAAHMTPRWIGSIIRS